MLLGPLPYLLFLDTVYEQLFYSTGSALVAAIAEDVPSVPLSICFWLRTRPEISELLRVAWNDERNTVKFLPGTAGDVDTSS